MNHRQLCCSIVQPFRILTITLLSLLIPLSFIVISRLSYAHYLIRTSSSSEQPPPSFFFSIFLYTNPTLLYAVISSITIATLIQGLTSKVINFSAKKPKNPNFLILPIEFSWILLCLLQISVGLGVEGTIQAGIDGIGIKGERSFLSKLIFFLGLHEIMLMWFRVVVKPVVDDTVYGGGFREERWVERVALAASCGGLWWWKLRDEVEGMVGAAEVRPGGGAVADFIGWWMYYITVTIGMVRVVKGTLWVGLVLIFKRVRRNSNGDEESDVDDDDDDDDDKV